jgi:hypothetical protein
VGTQSAAGRGAVPIEDELRRTGCGKRLVDNPHTEALTLLGRASVNPRAMAADIPENVEKSVQASQCRSPHEGARGVGLRGPAPLSKNDVSGLRS